ncbi:MAG: S-methyl-5-thioribose-1-phosphate isomerase [Pseudomonadales bacterium]
MKVGQEHYRTIWFDEISSTVNIIDQTKLPHRFEIAQLRSLEEVANAITTMQVRGAPLIGATAAYGIVLAMRDEPSDAGLKQAAIELLATRPTAINLRWALNLLTEELAALPVTLRLDAAKRRAELICNEDVVCCEAIGEHGRVLISEISEREKRPVNIMTHCNAGWLATVDWGTALAPVYKAFNAGIDLHMWVSETRPRNQGMYLTSWELAAHGVPHTVISDNAAGHLMQQGLVDLCIVGTDRTLVTGDVCNKIGTYLKALAADAHKVPFYVAVPSSSIEWHGLREGSEIPIEQRGSEEIHTIVSLNSEAKPIESILCDNSAASFPTQYRNDAFDVTPSTLVSGLITERGLCEASEKALLELFPEHRR